jgi:hypothetical protein
LKVIIVLGAPRSGTTLLAEQLHELLGGRLLIEPRLLWRYGNDARSDMLLPQHARPEVVSHIRRRLFEADGGWLVEKTPANALRPAFVQRVLPEARFVHVTRSGWEAVPSLASLASRRASGLVQKKDWRKIDRRLREAALSQWRFYLGELGGRVLSRGARPYGPRLPGLHDVAREMGPLYTAAVQWRECALTSHFFVGATGPSAALQTTLQSVQAGGVSHVLKWLGVERPLETSAIAEVTARPTSWPPLDDDDREMLRPVIDPVNTALGLR